MCPVFAVSLINHFNTSRSPMGSHIEIWYVPFRLFGLLLYCAQISLLSWTYFFQNKVLKVWHSFIITLCIWCIQYSYLHWKSELPSNITFFSSSSGINSDPFGLYCGCSFMLLFGDRGHVWLEVSWRCCPLWCDAVRSPKKYQCLKEAPSSTCYFEGRGTMYLQNIITFLPHYMASYFRNRMQLVVCYVDIQLKPAVSY
jgi:hypothetical protein